MAARTAAARTQARGIAVPAPRSAIAMPYSTTGEDPLIRLMRQINQRLMREQPALFAALPSAPGGARLVLIATREYTRGTSTPPQGHNDQRRQRRRGGGRVAG